MTSIVVHPDNSTRPERSGDGIERVRFSDLLRSEWIKFTSLPSMLVGLAGIVAIGVGSALFLAVTLASSGPPSTPNLDTTIFEITMGTVILGQIIAGILGVMSVGGEYSSGTIQSTLMAEPTRVRSLLAKAVMQFVILTATGLITVLGAWAVSYSSYAEFGLAAPLDAPGVAVALLSAACYLGMCATFGVGITALVRSTTTGAIGVFVVTLLGPVLSAVLPQGLIAQVVRMFFLGTMGDAMRRILPEGPFLDVSSGHISPLAAWALAAAWALVALVAGTIALRKRDA